jgi:hypothetical protein
MMFTTYKPSANQNDRLKTALDDSLIIGPFLSREATGGHFLLRSWQVPDGARKGEDEQRKTNLSPFKSTFSRKHSPG